MKQVGDLMMRILCCSLLLLAVTAIGCGDRGIDLPTAQVSGTVSYQGKPLEFGKVLFFHPSGHVASAKIAADGTFKLTAYQGQNNVAVECYDVDRPGAAQDRTNQGAGDFASRSRSIMGRDKSLIPIRYRNYSKSGLTFEVKPGENDKAEFILTD